MPCYKAVTRRSKLMSANNDTNPGTCHDVTTGPADPANGGPGGTLGDGKIGPKYGKFFANLTKVLTKI